MVNFRYERRLSEHLRYGNKKQKAALLKWLNNPKFRSRKPTPEELTAEFLRKGSPLYGIVKTKVIEAANGYWREKAQDILRHVETVRVCMKTRKDLTRPVREWVPMRVEQGGCIPEDNYIPSRRVVNNPELTATLLQRAHDDFCAWYDRFSRYTEFLSPKIEDASLSLREALVLLIKQQQEKRKKKAHCR